MKLLRRKRRSKAEAIPQPLASTQPGREPVGIEELSDRHLAQARGVDGTIGPGQGSGGNGVPPP